MISQTDDDCFIGVINVSSLYTKFTIFHFPYETEVVSVKKPLSVKSPKEGWAEQNPQQIIAAVVSCIHEAIERAPSVDKITAIGITNQRETTVVWDKQTGWPLYNAILWYDNRTSGIVDTLLSKYDQDKDHLKSYCGLPISTYFSALKLRWLIDNIPAVEVAVQNQRCCFGTIDSWIIWSLTGGTENKIHVTDVTNASRTMLMNIKTLKWDPILCRHFNIPMSVLPQIKSSSEIYGYIRGSMVDGVPISGVLGNQQAGLVGERCLQKGHAWSNYKTGCFILYNTGYTCNFSSHGLITTVAYQMGMNELPVYALEGSVAVAGMALQWLSENLNLANGLRDAESVANLVEDTGDVYFVPAFSGLYAPYWRKDARGVICGITQFTNRSHIVRACIEAICYQTKDILQAMHRDCEFPVTRLCMDGHLSEIDTLMQLQANITGIEVVRSSRADVASLGAAIAAAQAEGILAWGTYIPPSPKLSSTNIFLPRTNETERNKGYKKWKMAVQRSVGWAYERQSKIMEDNRYVRLSSIPFSIYIIVTFSLLAFTQFRRL